MILGGPSLPQKEQVWVIIVLSAFLPRQDGIWRGKKKRWNQMDRLQLCDLSQFILTSEPLSLRLSTQPQRAFMGINCKHNGAWQKAPEKA